MADYPSERITTPWGPVKVWATSAEHIGFATEGRNNVPAESELFLTLNGVKYHARVDLKPVHANNPPTATVREVRGVAWGIAYAHLDRLHSTKFQDFTWPALKKLRTEVTAHVLTWVDAHPDFLARAAAYARADKLEKLDAEIGELETKLETLRSERSALQDAGAPLCDGLATAEEV